MFQEQDLNRKEIYLLSWKVSLDCCVRSFQYKVLNVFYLNKKLFIFGKFSSICSFCKNVDVTILHLFYECNMTKALWKSLLSFFDKYLNFSFLSPQTAFLGFINTYCNDISLKNHSITIQNLCIQFKKTWKISLNNLIRNVTKVKNIEKEIAENNKIKVILYNKKWEKIENKLNKKVILINLFKRWGVKHFCWEIPVVFCYYFFIYLLFVCFIFFLCFLYAFVL